MKMRSIVGVMVLARFLVPYSVAQEAPNPVTLLQGVQSVRLQIPPSRLQIRTVYADDWSTNETVMLVEFDGDQRRFAKVGGEFELRSAFNGNEVIHFDGGQSVTVRDTSNSTSDYFFDPRLLGITTTYWWSESAGHAFPMDDSKIEVIGHERISGEMAWHVRITDSYEQRIDLWIDPDNSFRVYRFDFSIEGLKRNEALSFYENPKFTWLPSRVESRNYRANGRLVLTRVFTILKAQADVAFSDRTWTLAGLNLPIGVSVTDLRINRRVGYWNGSGLSPVVSLQEIAKPQRRRLIIILMVALATASFVALGFFLFRRSASEK